MNNFRQNSIKARKPVGWRALVTCVFFCHAWSQPLVFAGDDPPAGAVKYSDAVVAQAESILLANGLKRVGSQIQATLQSDLTRLFADETKQTRGLKLARSATDDAEMQLTLLQKQIELVEQKVGQLNAQFVIQGNRQGRNNELVATINAMTAQLKQMISVRDIKKEGVSKLKSNLGELEENYAETILKMRRNVDSIRETVGKASEVREVGIALKVLATRYSNSTDLDIENMIAPLDRKVRRFEALVFSETIDLESEGGGLMVQAVIGLQPVEMLIDSGASIVLIPRELAAQLEIKPADDAKDMTLRTADGRRIAAKQIFLPRLRVGQFEAENVEAALLETAIDGTRPLLGLSFLSKFRFEIDAAQKKLTLLEIKEAEDD